MEPKGKIKVMLEVLVVTHDDPIQYATKEANVYSLFCEGRDELWKRCVRVPEGDWAMLSGIISRHYGNSLLTGDLATEPSELLKRDIAEFKRRCERLDIQCVIEEKWRTVPQAVTHMIKNFMEQKGGFFPL